MASGEHKEYERRRNAPGWRPPRAPYNPYDPEDLRPPEGYPSEYNEPISKTWRVRAGENQDYRQFIDRMRMKSYPGSAPESELYPGRVKVLRRLRGAGDGFARGTHMASIFLCGSVITYGTFFYRWNDGYDNVFSGPYRFQLRVKKMLLGRLTQQEEEDLVKHSRIRLTRVVDSPMGNAPVMDTKHALERPRRIHMLEAERARQELEEAALRKAAVSLEPTEPESNSAAIDLAIKASAEGQPRKSWYKFW